MIRFQRIGRTNDPAFRIVVVEKERAAKTGSILEQVGTYNPKSKATNLKADAIKEYIAKGAQPTDSIHNLLLKNGVITGKKRNVLPKKSPPKKEEEAVAAPTTEAAASDVPVVEEKAEEPVVEPTPEAAPEAAPAEETPAEVPAETTA